MQGLEIMAGYLKSCPDTHGCQIPGPTPHAGQFILVNSDDGLSAYICYLCQRPDYRDTITLLMFEANL